MAEKVIRTLSSEFDMFQNEVKIIKSEIEVARKLKGHPYIIKLVGTYYRPYETLGTNVSLCFR